MLTLVSVFMSIISFVEFQLLTCLWQISVLVYETWSILLRLKIAKQISAGYVQKKTTIEENYCHL